MPIRKFELTFSSFESCAHCRDVYFFYLGVGSSKELPTEIFVALTCRCKEEAFLMLAVIRQFSKEPMADEQFNFIGSQIATSTLPEKIPDENVLAALYRAHANNPQVAREVRLAIDFANILKHRTTGPKDYN